MKLQLQPPSLGASRHLPVWCALLTPNHLSLSNLGSNCHSSPIPTTKPAIGYICFHYKEDAEKAKNVLSKRFATI